MKTSIIPLAVLVLASVSAHAQQHWYVDSSVPGPGNGSAQNPFPAIQTAVDVSSADDIVHVGPGGYIGNLVIDHDLTLIGTGSDLLHEAIYTYIVGAPTAQSTITTCGASVLLNGFVVSPGLWISPGETPVVWRGAGLLVSGGSVIVVDSFFTPSGAIYSGGAIAVDAGSLDIRSTRFSFNWAGSVNGSYYYAPEGGAIDGRNATSLVIRDSEFYGTFAWPPDGSGAAVVGDAWIENSLFVGCQGPSAVTGLGAGAVIVNSTFFDNDYVMNNATVHNSIVWSADPAPIPVNASVSVTHSIWKGGHPGAGNLDADPLFVEPFASDWWFSVGDFRLQAGSPAIDAADNGAVSPGVMTDLLGLRRFLDDPLTVDTGIGPAPIVDMGAIEYSWPLPTNYCPLTPNSVGEGANMEMAGSTSVAANDLVLVSGPMAAGKLGLFYYGPAQVQMPFGNGNRCVGGNVVRLTASLANSAGTLQSTVDNTGSTHGQIVSGTVLNFQAWFRDPAGGGAEFNLSDALSIPFTP